MGGHHTGNLFVSDTIVRVNMKDYTILWLYFYLHGSGLAVLRGTRLPGLHGTCMRTKSRTQLLACQEWGFLGGFLFLLCSFCCCFLVSCIFRKSKLKKTNNQNGAAPRARNPGGPPNPHSLCNEEIWCLLKPYFTMYKYIYSFSAPSLARAFLVQRQP